MRFIAPFLALLLSSSTAFADDNEARFSEYYGDGMRAYTESRYDDALTHLYRALAIKQTPYAMKLIIRSHDFQGNCSARERAADMLRDAFPQDAVPPTQRCSETGLIELSCEPDQGPVRVNGAFDAACGTTARVPVGVHELELTAVGIILQVDVSARGTTTANLTSRPDKWYLEERYKQVVKLPRRWLRPGLLVDPDMPRTFKWKRPSGRK